MSQHKVMILTVGIGAWYPRGIARMIERFRSYSPGFEVTAWINCYPPGAPGSVIQKDYEYGPYIAKPYAMLHALRSGADVAILLDAAFYPIRPIHPLIDHISHDGYYFCKNGNLAGEWASDRSLEYLHVTRDQALEREEISSYCVGLNFHRESCRELARVWAKTWTAIPGPHTNVLPSDLPGAWEGRNSGFCSAHPRVKGHRHDQTTLSLLAYELGMRDLTERPKFTAYAGSESEETVLVNQGMGS